MEVLPTPCMATIAEYLPQLEHGRLCVWLRDINRISKEEYVAMSSKACEKYVVTGSDDTKGIYTREMGWSALEVLSAALSNGGPHSHTYGPLELEEVIQWIPKVRSLDVRCFSPDDHQTLYSGIGTPHFRLIARLPALTSLTQLDISNQIGFDTPEQLLPLGELTSLTELHLERCIDSTDFGIEDSEESVLYAIAPLINLRILNLNKCSNVSGDDLDVVLDGMTNLVKLSLSRTGVICTSGIKHLPIQILDLSSTAADEPDGLDLPASVTDLDLSGRDIMDGLDSFLDDVPSLTRLQLIDCGISDNDIAYLSKFAKIMSLGIGFDDEFRLYDMNPVSDIGLQHLVKFKRLTELKMDNLDITDNGVANMIYSMSESDIQLKSLTISNCGLFTEAALPCLAAMKSLEELYLGKDGPEITTKGLAVIAFLELKRLSIISFAEGNDLLCLGKMTTLKSLNLDVRVRMEGPVSTLERRIDIIKESISSLKDELPGCIITRYRH